MPTSLLVCPAPAGAGAPKLGLPSGASSFTLGRGTSGAGGVQGGGRGLVRQVRSERALPSCSPSSREFWREDSVITAAERPPERAHLVHDMQGRKASNYQAMGKVKQGRDSAMLDGEVGTTSIALHHILWWVAVVAAALVYGAVTLVRHVRNNPSSSTSVLPGSPAKVGMHHPTPSPPSRAAAAGLTEATTTPIPSRHDVDKDAATNGVAKAGGRGTPALPVVDDSLRVKVDADVDVDVTFVGLETIHWKVLDRELDKFDRERHAALESLSFQLEVVHAEVLVVESESTGSDAATALRALAGRIERKIAHLSGLYEHDLHVLRRILRPFRYTLALPAPESTATTTNATIQRRRRRPHEADATPSTTTSSSRKEASTSLEGPTNICRLHGWDTSSEDRSASSSSFSAVYGTVGQVMAHLVRDWSSEGAVIRPSLYDWCVDRIKQHADEVRQLLSSSRSTNRATRRPEDVLDDGLTPAAEIVSILVPGAGLGRLAYDLAASFQDHVHDVSTGTSAPVHVHAIEPSLPMMAAVAYLFNQQQEYQQQEQVPDDSVLHPYASDPFTNEVDDEITTDTTSEDARPSFTSQRYRPVTIESPTALSRKRQRQRRGTQFSSQSRAHLSFTVGEFQSAVEAFRGSNHQVDHARYGFVVTCFFLDTASNPIDYIRLVIDSLMPGGYWINAGPLQWHANAQLALTTGELRQLLTGMGFDIVSWSVDPDPLEYRSPSRQQSSTDSTTTTSSSTRVEAYHPLRFVARKKKTKKR